jgi:hypothetical protein
MIDENTEFGARVARHLREEIVVWITTVTPAGAPKLRIRNLEGNSRVALNFGGDGGGGDIVVLSGEAIVDRELPPANDHQEYLAKYHEHIARIGMTPETFAREYSLPVRIRLTGLQGH